MTYTGKIVGKEFSNGRLHVKVQYSNGADTFNDIIETTQRQGKNWVEEQMRIRIVHLDALAAYFPTIEEGKEVTPEPTAPETPLHQTPRDEYAYNLIRFDKLIAAVAKGLTTSESEDFIALKKWLTDNFKIDYVDLF